MITSSATICLQRKIKNRKYYSGTLVHVQICLAYSLLNFKNHLSHQTKRLWKSSHACTDTNTLNSPLTCKGLESLFEMRRRPRKIEFSVKNQYTKLLLFNFAL